MPSDLSTPASPWQTRAMRSLCRHYQQDLWRSCTALARYRRAGVPISSQIDAAEAAIADCIESARRDAEIKRERAAALLRAHGEVPVSLPWPAGADPQPALQRDFLAALHVADEALALLERCARLGLFGALPLHRDDLTLRRHLRAVPALARSERLRVLFQLAADKDALRRIAR